MADVPLLKNPMTTAGDTVYGGASGAPTSLAIGTAGQVYKVNAGATAPEWADESAGGALTGNQIVAIPFGTDHSATTNGGAAGTGYALPILIASSMKLRAFWQRVQAGGSGTVQWGLFDYSSDVTAATKLAGGSGALSSTGWQSIAATSAPVAISPGCYILVILFPSSNAPSFYYNTGNTAGFGKQFNSYTWDDTPDLTAVGWVDTTGAYSCYLEGDMDGSAHRW
jgi:hypothetical protein